MNITLGEISRALDAKLRGDVDRIITDISFDSRGCHDGTLFAALKGEKRDGHDFIPSLVGSGAAVLCSQEPMCGIDAVVTDDVATALSRLAVWYKENRCKLEKTIAITGSVGKTTTKDITACVLSSAYATHKTQGNYNNALGVPMTLFGIQPQHRVLVCEMGMSGFGEIAALSGIAKPNIGMITNIGTSHIEKLGSRENICKAKLEILNGMKSGATLILNGDEPLLREAAKQYSDKYKIIFVGMKPENDITAADVIVGATTDFMICHDGEKYPVHLAVAGEHNVCNALFAFAAGIECGIAPAAAAEAAGNFRSGGMRQNVIEKNGIKIMADCYNASRESMCASIKVLCGNTYSAERRIAVLGEMRELGEQSRELHRDVGKCIAEKKPDLLFTLDGAQEIRNGAVDSGYPGERCVMCDSREALYEALKATLAAGDLVLFKASRAVMLEEIINKLGFEIK